jgi:serine/threonine protein kinase
LIEQRINNYKIISLLGEGGMATVYLAEHQSLGNKVAIKILKPEYIQHPNVRKRFLAEARNLAQMNHPNVIKVTDLIDAGDIVAFVMEYIDGETLEQYINSQGKLSDEVIQSLFNQMVEAIEYIHSQGFIHRDIKPSNFMLTLDGKIKLLDFGIAKNTNEGTLEYTKTGLMQQMGTPLYMSPEQIKNTSEITKETDYYSLGVVLWEMVTGRKPYDSESLSLPEIQVAILKEPLPLTNMVWDAVIQQITSKLVQDRLLCELLKNFNETKLDFVGRSEFSKKEKSISLNKWVLFLACLIVIIFSILFFKVSSNKKLTKNEITVKSKTESQKSSENNPSQTKTNESPKESSKNNQKETEEPQIEKQNDEQKNKLKIGQKHQGGIIFYLDESSEHGKVCTISDLGFYTWQEAVNECDNSNIGGYNNWYLPTLDELKQINKNEKKLNIIFDLLGYWSATEMNNEIAYYFVFSNNSNNLLDKSSSANVRAIRKF